MITFLPLASGFPDLPGHHRTLLDDRVRTNAFRRALARAVRPGDVVVDLGTGTGILALEARRLGARRVYGIERGPIVRVARAVAQENGVDGITFLEGHSRDVVVPEPADVIVSECLGAFAIGGTMLQAFTELRERCLKPRGRAVPEAVSLFLAPVESRADHAYVAAWERPRHGYRWGAAAKLAWNNVYSTLLERESLLCRPPPIARIDLGTRFDGRVAGAVEVTPSRAGTVHGLGGWFEVDLGEGARLSTAPGKPATVWRHAFFPLARPVRVGKKTPLRIGFESMPAPTPGHVTYFDWRVEVGGEEHGGSTRWSYPG